MTSSLVADIVTSPHHGNAVSQRCFGVARRHRKETTTCTIIVAPAESMNCDETGSQVRRSAAAPHASGNPTTRRKKRRPKHSEIDSNNPTSNNNIENDEADDTGSVCSGVSSASGSSNGSLRSTRKLRCSAHSGQRRRAKDCVEDAVADNMSADKLLTVCSGRPIAIVTRPEPEGGPQTTMDEFERLIYGPSEPLFSDSESVVADADVDLSTVGVAKHPPNQRRAAAGRHGNADATGDFTTESLFSAAQMINTNTFMKIAIIQNELKNVKGVSLRRAENDVMLLCRRADAVKDGCALSEQSLKGVSLLLKDTTKAALKPIAEKSEVRSFQYLQQIPQPNSDRDCSSVQAVRVHVTSSTVRRRLVTTEVDIELANNSLDLAEAKVNELEEELKALVGSMGSSTSDRKEKAIRDVTLRLKEAEARATSAERKIHGLQLETETTKGVTPSLKKHQQIGYGHCSFTLADLVDC